MTVNLSTLKAGDKVKLRNGEVREVDYVSYDLQAMDYPCLVRTKGGGLAYYTRYGSFTEYGVDPLDIVEIIPTKEASPWKPITEAPKDGTLIVGRFPTPHGSGYAAMCWDAEVLGWRDAYREMRWYENVTHFVPSFSME